MRQSPSWINAAIGFATEKRLCTLGAQCAARKLPFNGRTTMTRKVSAFILMATLAGAVLADDNSAAAAQTGKTPTIPSISHDQAAAEGDNNQAILTTSANATTPAKGANSFTGDQAKHRMEEGGFSNISDLKKDKDGVWHAKAEKSGSPVEAWVDYKGNVGN